MFGALHYIAVFSMCDKGNDNMGNGAAMCQGVVMDVYSACHPGL